jgi:hypothetical protein
MGGRGVDDDAVPVENGADFSGVHFLDRIYRIGRIGSPKNILRVGLPLI